MFSPPESHQGKECPKYLGLFVNFWLLCFAAGLMVARMLDDFLSFIYPVSTELLPFLHIAISLSILLFSKTSFICLNQ